MAMTLDQDQQFIEQLIKQVSQLHALVTQLTARSTSADEEHKQMHADLVRTQAQLLTQVNTGGGRENSC